MMEAPAPNVDKPTDPYPVRAVFIDGMAGIGEFWGIGRAMGQLWAVLYLSSEPMSMDALVTATGITKGHASTNLRALQRLGLVSRSRRPGDRKDYYTPQADLWAFARSILRERQQKEFDQALASTSKALGELGRRRQSMDPEEYRFLKQRLDAVKDFHGTIDRAVAAILKLEDLRVAASRLAPHRRRRAPE